MAFVQLSYPRNEIRGVYWNHPVRPSACLSVDTWLGKMVSCFPVTPVLTKLHRHTPHESRIDPVEFEVKRSKAQCMD